MRAGDPDRQQRDARSHGQHGGAGPAVAELAVAAARSLRKEAQWAAAGQQSERRALGGTIGLAATDEEDAGVLRKPADQRPAPKLGLGHEMDDPAGLIADRPAREQRVEVRAVVADQDVGTAAWRVLEALHPSRPEGPQQPAGDDRAGAEEPGPHQLLARRRSGRWATIASTLASTPRSPVSSTSAPAGLRSGATGRPASARSRCSSSPR